MGSMRLWARAELRRRWRSLLALVLLAGLPAGVAIAAASGASRTDSVTDRLVATTKPPAITMTTYFQQTQLAFADIAALPVVSDAVLFHGYSMLPPGSWDFSSQEIEELESLVGGGFQVDALGDELGRATGGARRAHILSALVTVLRHRDNPTFTFEQARAMSVPALSTEVERRFGVIVDVQIGAPVGKELPAGQTHLLEGRTARLGSIDEAVINYRSAQLYRWKVGDVVPLRLAGAGTDFLGEKPPKPGPLVRARIVGIRANLEDFVADAPTTLTFGPAFAQTYDTRSASLDEYWFWLARGPADVPAYDKSVKTLTHGGGVLRTDVRSSTAQIRRVFRVQGAALWVLSVSLGLVIALVFTQSFARQTMLQSSEYGVLRALGVARKDLALFSAARAAAVALAAVALAAIVAATLSPLTPFGTARLAEVHPGISLPAATFVGGLVLALALVFVLSFVPSLLAARAVTGWNATSPLRPSAVIRLVGSVVRRPSPAIGARFALEPGRGVTAVPVRSSLTASITGIVALLAALIVAASLQHLLVTPSLYGWNWDLTLTGTFAPNSRDLKDLVNDPAVSAVSVGAAGQGALFQVGRARSSATMNGIAVDPVKGTIEPKLLSGRIPEGAGEIALGTKSMQAIGARLGSIIPVELVGIDAPVNLRLVGEVVLPFDDSSTGVGEGLWTTAGAMTKLVAGAFEEPGGPNDEALVRLKSGVDRAAATKRLTRRFSQGDLHLVVPRTIRGLGRMSNLPVALAALLAALAAGTLAHMLTTSIRRRSRDLAILKTIGFSRGQVRSAVGWQAMVFVSVALAISIPLGIIVGRWTWNLIARYAGFAGEPALPTLQIVLVGLSALVAAALLATLPARVAARTPPALVLRTE